MRLGTLFFTSRMTSDMLKTQSRMSDVQLQLASARRILTPSQDPTGAKMALDTEKFLATTTQYQENIKQVRSRLELEETALRESGEAMQKLRELAMQGGTTTYTIEDRNMIADEVEELLRHLVGLANTRDSNGEYLFSGFSRQTTTIADSSTYPATAGGAGFTYQGDNGERLVPIASSRKVTDADNGYVAFFGIEKTDGTTGDIFSMVYQLAADLRTDPLPAHYFSDTLPDLDLALEQVAQVRSQAGARLAAVEKQEGANADFILNFQTQLSEVRDLDYAEAITRFNRETVALQAAQQTYTKIQGLNLFNYL
jgi:flagellar hook-associated protein 3 FlgL